ncbi:GNAT family N-acetyltransferase [Algicella marina]|uniref:GNAT family N-acetyltransferase n=1 Tax=Algicella marina TaxID=2683284 RepID=A0A6P1T389_9RHOB|nr:GNAT family N-acetyltransferase [Algicella marina]QHQ36477.1 GNAT family N-acetyltransferase [Algicella marina]
MDDSPTIEIDVLAAIEDLPAKDWDACADPENAARSDNPFTTHRFLKALEDSGSVGKGTGWQPRHLVARAQGEVIAVMPLYGKSHSQGEYIFDHNWAHAYERAGGRYYPKLQSAIPFTPATGRRFLTRPGWDGIGRAALTDGAIQLAQGNGVSSIHITFCTEAEFDAGGNAGLLQRTSQQFHWNNRQYSDFEAFLADLSSRKRKAIRKERRTAMASGVTVSGLTGDDIKPHHWDAFWEFYQDTGDRKWGTPYLTREFFEEAHAHLRNDILLFFAEMDGQPVAGALNFLGQNVLYGRYWGCRYEVPCLHFEMCYYQAIDFAIENNLERVEAGAQGSHKLARGYLPVPTYSLHWVADEGFAKAISQYLEAEREAIDEEIEIVTNYGPFRKVMSENEGGAAHGGETE